jgi:hypothetical protein
VKGAPLPHWAASFLGEKVAMARNKGQLAENQRGRKGENNPFLFLKLNFPNTFSKAFEFSSSFS